MDLDNTPPKKKVKSESLLDVKSEPKTSSPLPCQYELIDLVSDDEKPMSPSSPCTDLPAHPAEPTGYSPTAAWSQYPENPEFSGLDDGDEMDVAED